MGRIGRMLAAALSLCAGGLSGPAFAARYDAIDDGFSVVDALIEKGDYVGARKELAALSTELKADDPRVIRYYERNGAARLREGKAKEARAAFADALRANQRLKADDESAARAYAGLGLCLRQEKKDAYAIKFFRKALALRLDEGTRMFVADQIRELEGAPPLPAR
ncbi:MAG: tetratricopeptide repeat protein [Elusimicrobia bacterium]|nr:tetratricopeptide repeat protein [Elusimicrobiota bacterium]